ncbi:MAG: thiamine-phosphate synthase family protein [Candidatus Hodarchaeota archaeon]
MLRPPCEIVIPSFVRAVRVIVAKKLRDEEGFTQQEISHILGVSQPVVNQYLSKESREIAHTNLDLQKKAQETASEIIIAISSGFTEEKVLSSLCLACKNLRTDGPLCGAHKNLVSAFRAFRPCTACRTAKLGDYEELEQRRHLILEAESLIEFLSSLPKFAILVPAVGTQVCLALPSAEVLRDVVALPGGIVSVKGRPIPVSKHAEFGASKTTAGILLMKKKMENEANAAISLRNMRRIREILSNMGIKIMYTKGGDKNWTTIFMEREMEIKKANAIADEGGVGFEAILYLFAPDAAELRKSVNNLVRHL